MYEAESLLNRKNQLTILDKVLKIKVPQSECNMRHISLFKYITQ